MCLQNLGANMYDRLRSECEQHIEGKLEALLGQTPDVLAFLSLVQACWADHCEQMLTLRSIFLYLDRTYVMQAATKKSLWDMGLQIFRTHLARRPEVARKAVEGLLTLIETERSGEQVRANRASRRWRRRRRRLHLRRRRRRLLPLGLLLLLRVLWHPPTPPAPRPPAHPLTPSPLSLSP